MLVVYNSLFICQLRHLLKRCCAVDEKLQSSLQTVEDNVERRLSISFIYGMLQDANIANIVAANTRENIVKLMIKITKMKDQCMSDSLLHLAAYYLYSYYYYMDKVAKEENTMMDTMFHFLVMSFLDPNIQAAVLAVEFLKYKRADELIRG